MCMAAFLINQGFSCFFKLLMAYFNEAAESLHLICGLEEHIASPSKNEIRTFRCSFKKEKITHFALLYSLCGCLFLKPILALEIVAMNQMLEGKNPTELSFSTIYSNFTTCGCSSKNLSFSRSVMSYSLQPVD